MQFVGLSIFFFISGFSLFLNNKNINNVDDIINFYKKRVLRIFPLYLVFIVGLVLINKPSPSETLIYITGLQNLFYPVFISTFPVFDFVSAIIIFYLLFPFVVFFGDYSKMLIFSLIPLLCFAVLLYFNISDYLLLGYFSVFVAGIIASKANLYDKICLVEFDKRMFILTVLLLSTLLFLLTWWRSFFDSLVLRTILTSVLGIPAAVIAFYWAHTYVKVFNMKFRALFTFLAFSTLGMYFIFEPFYRTLGNALYTRFSIAGPAAFIVLTAFIPLVVLIGYLLQLTTNHLVDAAVFRLCRLEAGSDTH